MYKFYYASDHLNKIKKIPNASQVKMSSTSRRRSRGQGTVDGDVVTNTFGAEDIMEDAGKEISVYSDQT